MPEYNHIIKVDDAIHQILLPQGVLHKVLKSHRSITEPDGHTSQLLKPQVSRGKSGILL